MPQFNKHTIVVGTARSGTSWLSENMAKVFRYRMLFEPEHPDNTKQGYLIADRLITQANANQNREALHYLKKVFKNQVNSDWIAQNSNRKYKMHLWPFIPKHFIIKFVRGNLMAPYLSQQFGTPVVHVVRHPFEVIKSQQRVKFPWLYDLSLFLKQAELIQEIKDKYAVSVEAFINKTEIEQLALRWCIENIFPLDFFELNKLSDYHLIKHEDLRNDSQLYIDLCQKLDIEITPNLENEYKKPSSKAHPKSTVRGGQQQSDLNEKDKAAIKNVLSLFNQTLYEI